MNDPLTTPAPFAPTPLTAGRIKEIKTDATMLATILLQDRHRGASKKLLDMVTDLMREVERADGLMLSLLGVALADCTEDNHALREALARRQSPDSSL